MSNSDLEKRLERLEREVYQDGTTHVAILQDKSSSMSGQRESVINGFNEYLQELGKDENVDAMRLTLTQFDTRYRIVQKSRRIRDVPPLSHFSYVPGGMTALYDAIGRTINSLEQDITAKDKVLMVIMTDGQENSSTEYDQQKILGKIEECQERDNWTFVYLGADVDAFKGGTSIGIHAGNTMTFDATRHVDTYSRLAGATANYTASSDTASATFVEDHMAKDGDE